MTASANETPRPLSALIAKQHFLQRSSKWLVFIILTAISISASAIYLFFSRSQHIAKPPEAIAISVCPDLASGVHRIASDFGIRFDVPENTFSVYAANRDMPPETLYVVKLKGADAKIVVSYDDDDFRDLKSAYPVFSEHAEERYIRDSTGRTFGTDRWGYLPSGERWRYVKFSTGDAMGYEPTAPSQADQLDRVVNSACFSRDQNHQK